MDVSACDVGALEEIAVGAYPAGRLILRTGDEILVPTCAGGPPATDKLDAADFMFF